MNMLDGKALPNPSDSKNQLQGNVYHALKALTCLATVLYV